MPRGVARATVAAMAGSPPNRFNFVYATTKAESSGAGRRGESGEQSQRGTKRRNKESRGGGVCRRPGCSSRLDRESSAFL